MLDLHSYDYYVIGLSGGKDSVASLLFLLEKGIPRSKIEAWHHLVDGRESTLMDWKVTEDYCRVLCQSLKIPIYYSWRSGGLEKEMLRFNSPTEAVVFESPEGLRSSGGESNSLGTRLRFAQIGGSMVTRYCSSYAKIMVADVAIAHQDRFKGKRTLVVTGERRLESASRSKYLEFQPHRKHCKSRHVDHWRPVIDWNEAQVYEIASRWSIRPHPCYFLGFGRASCQMCIFASDNHLASLYKIDPERVLRIAGYERQFNEYWQSQGLTGYTIHRQYSVMERVARGTPFDMKQEHIKLALSDLYYESIFVPHGEWEFPSGAFSKDTSGPS